MKIVKSFGSVSLIPNATLLFYVDDIEPFLERIRDNKFHVYVEPVEV